MLADAAVGFQRWTLSTLTRIDDFQKALAGSATLQLDAENMKYHNSLQAIRAERFVFCQHQNFALLQEMLTNDPTLKSGPTIEIVGRSRRRARSK